MSPKDFQQRYKELAPDLTSVTGLHVDKYAMYKDSDTDMHNKIDAVKSAAIAFNHEFQTSGPSSKGYAVGVSDRAFAFAKISRASPAQLESILTAGVVSGHLKDDSTALQSFVDDCFRTDCVGFVELVLPN